MFTDLLKLILMTLLPVAVSGAVYELDRRTAFGRMDNRLRQAVLGVVFGLLAVLGTELSINVGDMAGLNVRDAAPLCAGLLFGGPAGIIAGVIGGVERWFAVLWGAGEYTRLACTLGTVAAGLFGAALRKWLFDDKKPEWYYALSTGLVTEIFHMLFVFITNMSEPRAAFALVRQCALPMILCNGVSVMLASLFISHLSGQRRDSHKRKKERTIALSIQRWLLVCVIIAFCATNIFTYMLQTGFAHSNADSTLAIYINDVQSDIEDASNNNLSGITRKISTDISALSDVSDNYLQQLKKIYDVSEISIVNTDGIIEKSTNSEYTGYDMSDGVQSAEFLVLLKDQSQYIQKYQKISKNGVMMKYAGMRLAGGGFVQVGYDAERFQSDIDEQIVDVAVNRHVGESGSILVADAGWNVISGPEEVAGTHLDLSGLDKSNVIQAYLSEFSASESEDSVLKERTLSEQTIEGTDYYFMYDVAEGYYIIAAMPVSEAFFFRDASVYILSFMELVVFAALFIVIYLLIKTLVVENIHRINETLSQITNGNLNVAVDVRSNREFASLSDDINSTVVTLKKYIADAAARIDQELEIARTIQSSTLPSVFPPYPERTDFDIYASSDSAKEVGGDFYDFYLLEGNRLAFLIADVSGKGISAAMFMMTAKTLIKSIAEEKTYAADILTDANNELCKNNDAGMFVTCWMGIIDLTTNKVSFANAGHNPPLVRHRDGSFEYFKSRPGLVLAGMEGIKYRQGEMELMPGDEIYLYTDGVTEAMNSDRELYGNDRLLDVLNTQKEPDAKTLCEAVRRDVDIFVGEADQFDDITMLSLKINHRNSLEIEPELSGMDKVQDFAEEILRDAQVGNKIILKMKIAIDEIFSNIVNYSGAKHARIDCQAAQGLITLTFIDDGKFYNPLEGADPDITSSAEDRSIGGLGVFMVKKSMDSVDYRYSEEKNILTLRKTY